MSYTSKQTAPESQRIESGANKVVSPKFADQRASTSVQLKQQEMMGAVQRAGMEEEEPLQGKFATAQRAEDEELLQGKFETAQLAEEEEEPLQGKFETAQLAEDEELLQGKLSNSDAAQLEEKPNNTGLPNQLKSGIESLSGMSMDNVKVHYNSDKPAQLNAHAYAQGTDIHVAPGQEQHLPHEAWHVVQQAQGRVQPTAQMKGTSVNDDVGLETEADVMGARAISYSTKTMQRKVLKPINKGHCFSAQRLAFYHGGGKSFVESAIANPHAAKASEGELGSKGMYYWKDDENAALISAVIYNAAKDWAVMKIDVKKEVYDANQNAIKSLVFASDSVAPVKTINGTNKRVLGVHYRFIQNNLETKLSDAKPDNSTEGVLADEYKNMTGREFLDSFDLIISPTKADAYIHKMKQARANDTALTNIIYGEAGDGTKNTFTKTWEGKITDVGHQATLVNMGLSKKNEVPDVIQGLNGKKGTVVTKS
ncbi:MAG: DUF4157 domain-containing protein [Cellvibrio sp.]|uniref:eCIS core domain-containing protein n=1 Tax=Cellvibrio sp. TaxID=1965322 RepID=UPI0031AC19B4